MVNIFVFSFLISALICSSIASINVVKPGVNVHLTETGLSKTVDIAIQFAIQMLPSLTFPTFSGDTSAAGGKVHYEVSGCKINSIIIPDFHVSILPSSGLAVDLKGLTAVITGRWSYVYKLEPITIRDSGDFKVTAKNLQLITSFQLGADNSGRLTIKTTGCSGAFREIDLELHARFSWFYDLFKGRITEEVNKPCTFLEKFIDNQVADELKKHDLQMAFKKNTVFDFRLVESPRFENEFAELLLKAEFFYKGNFTEAPLEPKPFPKFKTNNRMVSILVSEYVFNTFSYVMKEHRVLEGTVTKNDLPSSMSDLFNTTCFKFLCIGFFIPQLGTLFPQSYVEIEYNTTETPKLKIASEGASVTLRNVYSFQARLPNNSLANLFTLSTNMSFEIALSIEKNSPVIHWKLFKFNMSSVLIETNIGWIPSRPAAILLECLIRLIAIPKINKEGSIGNRLPIPDKFVLRNTKVQFGDGATFVEGDFDYTGFEKFR